MKLPIETTLSKILLFNESLGLGSLARLSIAIVNSIAIIIIRIVIIIIRSKDKYDIHPFLLFLK